jgi:hypothetical protein
MVLFPLAPEGWLLAVFPGIMPAMQDPVTFLNRFTVK